MTTVSIIIPVYNRGHLIEATLHSLLVQSWPVAEIIVVDDCSTDDTSKVVERIGGPVRLIRQAKNSGPAAARNAGLEQAQGSHILFFDSDDLATPDYVANRMQVAEMTRAQIVYGSWMPIWLEGEVCYHDGFVRQSRPSRGDAMSAFLNSWILFLPNCLIERSLLESVGGYPIDLRTSEDMLLLFRLLKAKPTLAFAPGSLLLVRQHPEGQISASSDLAHLRAREELVMISRVIAELGTLANLYSGPLRAWRARRAACLMRIAREEPEIFEEFGSISRSELIAGRLWLLQQRVEAALYKRIAGHRIPRVLEPAPIRKSHIEHIRRLGLAARKSSRL